MNEINETTHYLNILNSPYPAFDMIKSGQKTVEGRRDIAKYQYKSGDIIILQCKGKESLLLKIIKIVKYTNVYEYLNKNLKIALPGVDNIEEGIQKYCDWIGDHVNDPFLGIFIKKFN